MKILIIGGTGLIGSKVVEKLKQQCHEAVAAAPNTGVDTITGRGLAEAMAGAEVVVDVSNSPSLDAQAAMDFFATAGRNIAAAEAAAGVRRHVALSVVGTERLQDSGYFRAKLAQERLIRNAGIPYTLIHATQFFEFARGIAESSTQDGVVRLPPVLFQPMAADDVANAVAAAAIGAPVNGTIEIAGPEPFRLDALVRKVLAFDKDAREVVADEEATYFGVRVDDRSLMPGPEARLGTIRFDWWLTNVPPPRRKPIASRPQASPAQPRIG
jgi:uncharacterized protein YbjT (DUF2867 family)